MPSYRYAIAPHTPHGEPERGLIEAGDRADALRQLTSQGLDPSRITLTEMPPDTFASREDDVEPATVAPGDQSSVDDRPLRGAETQTIAGELSGLIDSGLPLPDGLRALAEELGPGRSARLLWQLAQKIEEGESLADALRSAGDSLPPHLRGLIQAGMASGQLSKVLEEYVDLERDQSELRRRMWLAVTYPIVLLTLMFGLLVGFGAIICPQFNKIFCDFGTELPAMTGFVLWAFGTGVWYLVPAVALCASLFLFALMGPAPLWMRMCVYQTPIFGPFWRWSRLMPFARLMALFTEQETPLPDALRWTAAGLGDRHLIAGCHVAAERVEAGESLAASMAEAGVFPVSTLPLLDWGGRFGSLSAAFRFTSDSIRNRTHLQTDLAPLVVLPAAVLCIALVGITIISMFLPLIRLIETLS